MRLYLLILFVLFSITSIEAQKIKKDKQAAISEIKSSGKTIYSLKDDPNSFYYNLYDEDGEASVLYVCENNEVKKVMFICQEPNQVPKRALQAFKTSKNYKVDPLIQGVFTGTNSCYYEGRARYEGVNNYNEKKFYLEIILLD